MKEKKLNKKLVLNKETVTHFDTLGRKELKKVKGAKQDPCWENLWTVYHCDVIYTGDPEVE